MTPSALGAFLADTTPHQRAARTRLAGKTRVTLAAVAALDVAFAVLLWWWIRVDPGVDTFAPWYSWGGYYAVVAVAAAAAGLGLLALGATSRGGTRCASWQIAAVWPLLAATAATTGVGLLVTAVILAAVAVIAAFLIAFVVFGLAALIAGA